MSPKPDPIIEEKLAEEAAVIDPVVEVPPVQTHPLAV